MEMLGGVGCEDGMIVPPLKTLSSRQRIKVEVQKQGLGMIETVVKVGGGKDCGG